MRRREFITVLAGSAVWPLMATAQQSAVKRRIGALMLQSENNEQGSIARNSFEQGLARLGWIVGRNLEIDYRWDMNETEKARLAVAQLLALAPNVIVANGTQALAGAQQSTRTVPIVFAAVSEPVRQGFVASLARPGGNITGFTNLEPTVAAKWLELLKAIAPKITRVTVVFNLDTSAFAMLFFRAAEAASRKMGVQIILAPVHDDAGIEASLRAAGREPGGGVIIPPDPFMSARSKLVVDMATRYDVPAIYEFKFFAAEGGLLSYGIDLPDLYSRSASYVDRILRGEQPADLPVQQPTKFQLVINLKTAKTLGLTVPAALLATADEVIE
jgi:putative tryptophan/tyrosine transport system substrate-binding protein